ncbi:PCNA-associated factor [Pelobates cultripes]|uniref:PCNA-associated factor n=1 Tax=Pelobates cultripes TaxID=61616 RepID=A0AAD1RKA9_PELCU|nr:PCNA-associated factor [Pelobates cultripes]
MVRTKADSAAPSGSGSYRKAVAARAPRKSFGSPGPSNNVTSPTGKKADKYAGGNPVCVRPTPKWQKGIGEFFGSPSTSQGENENQPEKENRIPSEDEEEAGGSGTSKAPRKSRRLPSDDEAASDDE